MANGKTIQAVKTGIKDLRSVAAAGKSSSKMGAKPADRMARWQRLYHWQVAWDFP